MNLTTTKTPGDWIDGSFRHSNKDGELEIRSPADRKDVVAVFGVDVGHVDEAVAAARGALRKWRTTKESEREALLRRFQEKARKYESQIAETISREVGKPLWEGVGEAKAIANKVDLILGVAKRYTEDEVFPKLPGAIRYRAHGVMAVIGPFNFPGHLPNGQIVPALAAGNTVVFKPSEKTPTTGYWLARCAEEAGFPKGVFNVVQGGAESAKRLSVHDGIDGILFTGSVEVGKAIVKANAHRPDRLIALELGGKNASIVLSDANLPWAIRQIAFSGFATTGQRCTATSRVFVAESVFDEVTAGLANAAQALKVGYALDEGVFMGPLIDEAQKLRLLTAQDHARASGFEALAAGGPVSVPGRDGAYVLPAVHLADRSDLRVEGYSHTELFGPDLAVYPIKDLDEAIERTNDSDFGLSTAVFTESGTHFEHAAEELRVGVVQHNRSTAGASGSLPFGGAKSSGNHRPAGVLVRQLCAWPQAVLGTPAQLEPAPSWPGFPST